uniref:Uncharacterized protein n=1 Tax=Rhabditophanes sp. KR3021 TaxID=114890 RepID=A0AC35THW7_9BILA
MAQNIPIPDDVISSDSRSLRDSTYSLIPNKLSLSTENLVSIGKKKKQQEMNFGKLAQKRLNCARIYSYTFVGTLVLICLVIAYFQYIQFHTTIDMISSVQM